MATVTEVARAARARTSSLAYVPALDGLRALAVLAVMLYHGGISWMPGGFLGVDLFFVLSGYLITTLLLREHLRWGSIDLFGFWARRARRLLPALFLMLLAIAVYAATLAPTSQQSTIRGEGLATLFYVSNWWAIIHGHSYFDQFLQPSPLTHTWSLAIEEQWYLLFPILLSLVLAARRPSRGLAVGLGVGALASALLMASWFEAGADPSRVYFGTATRSQDLLVGAVLAAWLAAPAGQGAPGYRPPGWDLWSPVAALGLVVLAMALVGETDPYLYRGGFLIFCILCAVVIASCVRPGGGPLRRILSLEPVRLVGVISYGLYLWHWPVDVVLTPARTGWHGGALLAVRLAVTTVVAVLSYVLLERPIRGGALERRFGPRPTFYLAVASCGVVAAALIISTPAASPAFASDGSGAGGVAAGTGRSVFFVGDSVSYNLRYYFDPQQTPGISLDGSAHLGCGLIPKTNLVDGREDPPGPGCTEWAAQWPGAIEAAHPDLGVLFLGSWEQFDVLDGDRHITFGTPEYAAYLDAYLDRALRTIDEASGEVAVVNVPCHRVVEDGVNPIPTIVNDQKRVDWLNDYLAGYRSRSAVPFTLIDLNRFVCVDGDPVERDGVQMRTDGLHFSPEGAALVWQWLGPQLADATAPTVSPAAGGRPTMFLVGDSVAYGLRYYLDQASVPDWNVLGSTRLGCGLFPSAIDVAGEVSPPAKGCRTWAKAWPAEAVAAHPDVGVLFLGIGEQYDVVRQGRTLAFGTPAYADYLDERMAAALTHLDAAAHRIFVVNVPCHHVPEEADNHIAEIANDRSRSDWINAYLDDYRRRAPVRFTLVDLNRYLCGDTSDQDDASVRADGLHFTQGGAALVWRWLGPQLTSGS